MSDRFRTRPGSVADRFRRDRVAVGAMVVLLAVVLLGVIGPYVVPYDPNAQQLLERLAPPSAKHLLGTDTFGRDTLSRLIVATRITLLASVEGLFVAMLLGVPLGLFAGYIGGSIRSVLGRISDSVLTLPPLILAIAIVAILGPGLTNVMIAIGIVFAPRFFRVAEVAAASVKHETYIEACRADGCSPARVFARHLIPNASSPLLVQATFTAGVCAATEASLSFLGLGVQPPAASWGSMVRAAFADVQVDAFQLLPPTIALCLFIVALFLVGDGLRDALGRAKVRQ